MVYIDHVHMVADSLDELHAFANKIGLSRYWFEGMRKGHPHYDVKWTHYDIAIQLGAQRVDSKTILIKSKALCKK